MAARRYMGVLGIALLCMAQTVDTPKISPRSLQEQMLNPTGTEPFAKVAMRAEHALLWGVICPGAGQLYNGAWKKFAWVYSGMLGFGAPWWYYRLQEQYWTERYMCERSPVLLMQKDSARLWKDIFGMLTLLTYVAAAVDAYVHAHLEGGSAWFAESPGHTPSYPGL